MNFGWCDVCLRVEDVKRSRGFAFDVPAKAGQGGGGSATLRDPDGHAIFFDTAPGETRKD